jgi:mono/diheme cytochrome c family protein
MTRLTVLGVLALLLLPAWGCSPLDDAVVAVFGRSMRDQPTFDPYENPRPAPEGSVPFAAGNLPSGPFEVNLGQPQGLGEALPPFTQLDVLNEAPVVMGLSNPVALSEASLERGQELYLRFCAPCHGPNGNGVSGYIIPAGYPPFPLLSDRAIAFTDGYLYGMIRVGRGLMPGYGHQMSHFDRWHVVNYLRLLQGVASAPALPGGTDDPVAGEVRQASPQGPGGSSN